MKRILFVDDDSKILDGIRRMLYSDRHRWDMQFAISGEVALKAFEAGPFDVVVSDMRMPVMDGATLLGKIRDRCPSSARIILSGYSEPELATRAVAVAHRFLAKPCNESELRSTIERTCALQDLLSNPDLRKIVGEVTKLPSLSTTYISLTRLVNDPNASISKISAIMEQDMAMSAKVLQLVNSAFFGLAREVTSITHAVSFLGMQTIKNLVLTAEVFSMLVPVGNTPLDYDALQTHVRRTAEIAARLPLDPKKREVAVIAALLHDAGKLFLASKAPQAFNQAYELAQRRGCELFEGEEEVLGCSHAEVGAYLLGLWGIPHLAVEAIAHHHRPTRIAYPGLDNGAAALYAADLLAHEPAQAQENWPRESDRVCLQELGIWTRFPELRQLSKQ